MEADTPRTLYAPCALSLGTLYKLSKEVQAHSPAQRLALLFKKRATTFKKFSLRLPTDAHQISEFCTGIVEKELINTQDWRNFLPARPAPPADHGWRSEIHSPRNNHKDIFSNSAVTRLSRYWFYGIFFLLSTIDGYHISPATNRRDDSFGTIKRNWISPCMAWRDMGHRQIWRPLACKYAFHQWWISRAEEHNKGVYSEETWQKKHVPLKWRGVFQAHTLCEKWAFA